MSAAPAAGGASSDPYHAAVMDSGPVAYWRFDEAAGEPNVTDIVANLVGELPKAAVPSRSHAASTA